MDNSSKVFVAGSRRLSKLSDDVRRRIDNIVRKKLAVIVGDASGVDKAIQQYLRDKHYGNVTVFCMEGSCRNNVGDWPTRSIAATDPSRHDFAYFSTKDRVMVEEADYGFMLWDGKSRGTLRSIVDLVKRGKPVVIYMAPDKTFRTLRQSKDLAEMLAHIDPATIQGIQGIDHDLHSLAVSGESSRKNGNVLLF
jgi:hypothetical protein